MAFTRAGACVCRHGLASSVSSGPVLQVYQVCQLGENATCCLQVECSQLLAAAFGCSLTPPTHRMPACRIAKLGELNKVSEGVPVECGNAGGCTLVGVVRKFETNRAVPAATVASPATGGQQQSSLPKTKRPRHTISFVHLTLPSAELVNGMVVHPLAREPAHYGPVRSIAAAVSAAPLAHPCYVTLAQAAGCVGLPRLACAADGGELCMLSSPAS